MGIRRELNEHPRRRRKGISLTIPGTILMVSGNRALITKRLQAEMRYSGAYNSDYSNVPYGEYYYGSDYLRVCTLGMKDLPGFYKVLEFLGPTRCRRNSEGMN